MWLPNGVVRAETMRLSASPPTINSPGRMTGRTAASSAAMAWASRTRWSSASCAIHASWNGSQRGSSLTSMNQFGPEGSGLMA